MYLVYFYSQYYNTLSGHFITYQFIGAQLLTVDHLLLFSFSATPLTCQSVGNGPP